MSEKPHEFWNIDLGKLTFAGWLLILLTIGAFAGTAVGILLLLDHMGMGPAPGAGRPGWVKAVVGLPALAVACGIFEGVRRLFRRIGVPITRESPSGDRR